MGGQLLGFKEGKNIKQKLFFISTKDKKFSLLQIKQLAEQQPLY
jgi:hypothetical protein